MYTELLAAGLKIDIVANVCVHVYDIYIYILDRHAIAWVGGNGGCNQQSCLGCWLVSAAVDGSQFNRTENRTTTAF